LAGRAVKTLRNQSQTTGFGGTPSGKPTRGGRQEGTGEVLQGKVKGALAGKVGTRMHMAAVQINDAPSNLAAEERKSPKERRQNYNVRIGGSASSWKEKKDKPAIENESGYR